MALSRVRWHEMQRFLKARLPSPIYRVARSVWRSTGQASMVTRQPRAVRWFRREVLRKPPVLQHFEIHLTDHCNLTCRGCSHFSNITEPHFTRVDDFERDMRAMARLFPIVRHIFLLGGEPLLHPDAARFVRLAREIYPDTEIHLLTNGTLVARMSEGVWQALADTGVVLMIGHYPIDLPKMDIEALAKRHGAALEWTQRRDEFHKVPLSLEPAHDAAASFARCDGYNNCPIVRDGRLYPCSFTAYSDSLAKRFDLEGLEAADRDSLELSSIDDPNAGMRFLTNPIPWCAHCDIDARAQYAWEQVSAEPGDWLGGG